MTETENARDPIFRRIAWEEPNRGNTPPLHIGQSGERYSTVTGVWWLDEHRLIVSHRSGLRIALFDLRVGDRPVVIADTYHLTDDIAAKKTGDDEWELAVSGCWAEAFSVYKLSGGDKPAISWTRTAHAPNSSFSHGVAYDPNGNLWVTFSTGVDPRVEIADAVWRLPFRWNSRKYISLSGLGLWRKALWKLPTPWGVRDICFERQTGAAYAVAVSANPKRHSYRDTSTSIWKLQDRRARWEQVLSIDKMHSDACAIFGGMIWLPDQLRDRVIAVDMKSWAICREFSNGNFDFPHGLDVSASGQVAVTNYGDSSITIFSAS